MQAPGLSRGQPRSSSEDVSEGDESYDDEDDDDGGSLWRPLVEDKSEPCKDELGYIASRAERSAMDHEYWERKTFFDMDDPEIVPGASGRIDWLVCSFNGTEEHPNKEHVMRSPSVNIGGLDWQIKFYPKGNDTDHLSVYIECASLQGADFKGDVDFTHPPIPFHAGAPNRPKKRVHVAAQVSVVMYNPAEPRTYEYHTDAHQFHKQSADYGWTRFTRFPRRDFPYRNHGQRQAILRDDKLAFKAYIRIVHDPTGCLWEHGSGAYDDSIAMVGARPFSPLLPLFSADAVLLHFLPFRRFIQKCQGTNKFVRWMHILLWKMISRQRSVHYGGPVEWPEGGTTYWLQHAVKLLRKETDASIVTGLLGSAKAEHGAAISSNRLRTKTHPSVQRALEALSTPPETPSLLTLELERHEFNRGKRQWHKITNAVEIQNEITILDKKFFLFAMSTHCGDLKSGKWNCFIRPRGAGTPWYAYTKGRVRCLTHKQAVEQHQGSDEPPRPINRKRHATTHKGSSQKRSHKTLEDSTEVAHVVFYVREDAAAEAFAVPVEEKWKIPEHLLQEDSAASLTCGWDKESVAATSAGSQHSTNGLSERKFDAMRENVGSATPHSWVMDHEGDVLMSDPVESHESSTPLASAKSKAAEAETRIGRPELQERLVECTIDHLGQDYYTGQMLRSLYHGKGHLILMNGDEYHGDFREGVQAGQGTMVYASSGDTYEGDWVRGQKEGYGTLTEAATGNVYKGGWKADKKHGAFTLCGTVTEEDKGCCGICYERPMNTAFYDCGHVVACKQCALQIENCPVCRRRVLARLELFGVKMSLQ